MTNTNGATETLLSNTFIYILGGGLGGLIAVFILVLIYNCTKQKPKAHSKEMRKINKVLEQLDDPLSEAEEEEPRRRKKSGRKKISWRNRKSDKIHSMKTQKSKAVIRTGGREMRKARTPSFFERQNARRFPITRICFTGGPCAGKTTVMAHCADQLRQLGIKTYIVPEAASILSKGGATRPKVSEDKEKAVKFQINLLKLQMSLEDTLMEIASDFFPEDKVVILCDMGTKDASVPLTTELWDALLDETGWTDVQLRDKRYDMVIHMVTAADGAEEYFKRENAETRSEDIENALSIDRRTRHAWVGHPSFW